MKPTVVILLSEKRSGSTFFERELCAHAGVQHVGYTPHSYNETHYWVMAACLLRKPKRLFSACGRPRVYGSRKQIRRTLEKLIKENVPDFAPPENDRSLVFQGWEALCQHCARPVFFEKSPQHPHHWAALELMLEWSQETRLTVKFIGLVRHPLAVLYSAKKLFHSQPQERQYPWLEANHNILLMSQFISRECFMIIRYEDLVENARDSFGTILQFIGLTPDPELGQTARPGSLSSWKRDAGFSVTLDSSVIRLGKHFGYSDFSCSGSEGNAVGARIQLYDRMNGIARRALARLFYLHKRIFR